MTNGEDGRNGQNAKMIEAFGGLLDRLTGADTLEAHERPESLSGERFVEGDAVLASIRRALLRGTVLGIAVGAAAGVIYKLAEVMM